MATYNEQMQAIFDRYSTEVNSSPVSLDDVAAWAIEKRLYQPAPRDVVKLCREALADSLRLEKRIDEKGRRYRAKHTVREIVGGKQLNLWADIDHAPRAFMEKSFGQRRRSVVDDCFQVKQDVDHFNDSHAEDAPIQIVLDFTDDVAEMEAAERAAKGGGQAA